MVFLNYFLLFFQIFSFTYGRRPIPIGEYWIGETILFLSQIGEEKKIVKFHFECVTSFYILRVNWIVFLTIGGIFHDANSDEEIAFRNALLRENKDNTKLEFIPLVREVERGNSFQAEKVGQLFTHLKQIQRFWFRFIQSQTACELASQGVVAIFGPTSTQTSSKLYKWN